MKQEISASLLTRIETGAPSTTELVRETGHSPNTVVRYVRELEGQGLVRRQPTTLYGPGRPPTKYRISSEGSAYLRTVEHALFRQAHAAHGAIWGPARSFARWGVPFVSGKDLLARHAFRGTPFELVLDPHVDLYLSDSSIEGEPCMGLEALAVWALQSRDARYMAAVGLLLRRPELDPGRLLSMSTHHRCVNRLGFVAEASGNARLAGAFSAHPRWESMTQGTAPVDERTAQLASTWHVRRPLMIREIARMEELYGAE